MLGSWQVTLSGGYLPILKAYLYWRNENALEEYLQSNRFKTFMGAIETLGELIHFNKVQFQNIQQ